MRRIAAALALGAAAIALATVARAGDNIAVEQNAVVLSRAQTQFVLRCGGCHGTLGNSPPRSVPQLRHRAGWFLCTPEGRAYVIRVPNVSRTPLDDAELAAVMNFVMFELGAASAPKGAARFTADEVHRLRGAPLNNVPLVKHRRQVVSKLIKSCGAPKDMLDYGKAVIAARG